MGYLRKRIASRRKALSGLGDLASIINSVGSAVGTSIDIVNDPYLSEVVCHLGQIQQINNGQRPGQCSVTPDGLPGGVGLSRAVKPLRYYVYAEQNKWVYALAAAVLIGVPMLIGYDLGKGSRGGG
jgi:hypothetical protein